MSKKRLSKSKSRQVPTAAVKAKIKAAQKRSRAAVKGWQKRIAAQEKEHRQIEKLLGEEFETLKDARAALSQAIKEEKAERQKIEIKPGKKITGREIIERAIGLLEVRGPGVRAHISKTELTGKGSDMLIKITIKTPSYERIAVGRNIANPAGKIRKPERWSWSTIRVRGHSRRRKR